ncbi:MAG: DUF2752 domain-containing protein [Bacteroidetes bacterium]|nr:DUF2752 domain-containing protein [Bacteroidota bacterium]
MDLNWLQDHLIPCPIKSITGIDCPGCGFQRSLLFLLRGDLIESIKIYPALIPLLLTFIFLFLHLKFRFRKGTMFLLGFYFFSAAVIVVSYLYKEIHHLS